jgi:hypothetical protein
MAPHHISSPADPEGVIDALLLQQTRLAGDIVEVDHDTWAIHGSIPVDGEVIVAEFRREADARAALDHIPPDQPA